MRRLLLTLTTSIVGVGLMSGLAMASTATCTITTTGANSTNIDNCIDTNNKTVICNNKDVVVENNNQTAVSGNASSSSNTSAGGATSGNASNNNIYTIKLGASCAPVAGTTSGTFTTQSVISTQPQSGGKGGGSATTASPTNVGSPTSAAPNSLPNTGSNGDVNAAVTGAGILGGLALVAASSVALLKRHMLR